MIVHIHNTLLLRVTSAVPFHLLIGRNIPEEGSPWVGLQSADMAIQNMQGMQKPPVQPVGGIERVPFRVVSSSTFAPWLYDSTIPSLLHPRKHGHRGGRYFILLPKCVPFP